MALPKGVERRGARLAAFDAATLDADARTVELAFSSETPVERWWGVEILGHDPGEIDDGFISSGTAPLLMDHNGRDLVGVVESTTLGADRKMRATVRFGKSARASEVMGDVADRIRCNVSVGYELLDLTLIREEKGKPPVYRAKWRPYEVSLVSVPADMTVGVGRDAEAAQPAIPAIPAQVRSMSETATTPPPAPPSPEAIAEAAQRRTTEIMDIAALANARDAGFEAIRRGITPEAFRGELVASRGSRPLGTPATEIGMSPRDTQRYSVLRAMRGMVARARGGEDMGRVDDRLEREASAEVGKRLGRDPSGIFVPLDVQQRDLTVGTAAAGGNLVATELPAGSMIDLLRNRMMVRQMGATVLGGLVGNLSIPRQTAAATAYWVAENGAPTESQQTVGQVSLTPKTVGAFTDYSRRLMLQSSIDVEQFTRADLMATVALAIDLAALHGSGSGNQPTGIAATAGIGSVAGGTNGAAPTWGNIVDLESAVATANADEGALGYLTNPKVRGKLKQTEKSATTGVYVWGDGPQNRPGWGMMNGYAAGATMQVSSGLTKGSSAGVCSAIFFGNWADLLVGEWGVLDVQVDPYTGGAAGTVRVRVLSDVDVAVRRSASFSAMLDALTA